MTLLDRLHSMPPGSLVPVHWLCEQLEASGRIERKGEAEQPAESWRNRPYLNVRDLAELLGRDESTIRSYFREKRIPEAYRFGRSWRTTPKGFQAFLDALVSDQKDPQPDITPERKRAVSLSDWRKYVDTEHGRNAAR